MQVESSSGTQAENIRVHPNDLEQGRQTHFRHGPHCSYGYKHKKD